MKNLMTRKLLFGMLMTLVLAFSVQGIVDALTFGTSRSGDLVTVAPNQTFTIRFSVSLRSASIKSGFKRIPSTDTAGDAVTINSATPYYDDSDSSGFLGDTPVSYADAHNYDEEAIVISADSALTLQRSNSDITQVATVPSVRVTNITTASLYEGAEDSNRRLSSSITLTGSTAAVGEYDITITDVTPAADFPDGTGPTPLSSTTFTIYVVDHAPATPRAEWGFITTVSNGYRTGGDDYSDQPITTRSTSAHVRSEYSVVEGSGRLYVQKDTRKGSAARTLSTSSAAVVMLDMNGTTNKVRASIGGAPSETAIFIFGYPSVEIVSGNNQEGALGGRLENPLVVRVTDGKSRTISGLAAKFDIGTGTDAMFFPVPGSTVYTTTVAGTTLAADFTTPYFTVTATSTRPGAGADILVQTDSRGEAGTYFQLGTTDTETTQTVTVEAGGIPEVSRPTFRFTAGAATGIPSIEIVSGNNQRSVNGNIDDPLVVVVRRRGQRAAGVQVTFTTDRGVLNDTPIAALSTEGDDDDDPSTSLDDMTDGQGRASVTYSLGDFTGAIQVVASISGTDPVTYRREVTFGINGGRSTGTTTNQQQQQQQQQQSTTPSLTLSSTAISGAAGSSQTITATVRRGTSPAPSVPVTLTVGTIQYPLQLTNSSGVVQLNFVLPSSSITASVSANVLGTVVSESVQLTVSGTADDEDDEDEDEEEAGSGIASSLIIDGDDDITGERNRREELVVQVVDRNGEGVTGELVRFLVTEGRGRLSPSLTRTDSGGYADVSFTPTSDGFIEVEVTSGDLTPVYFTITTGEPPDAIVVVSGNNQSGRPGAALANPFVVEVIDTNDDPVSGVTVNFAVTAGGGSVSPASATTNNNGRAQTTLTLGSEPGDNTVAARVTGLTAVNFKATSGAEVRVDASQRAPIYWINRSNETLHRLVGAKIENLVPNVSGIKSLAIDSENGHLYWSVQVGQRNAQIRRSNLDGTGARTVRTLTSAPSSIAIDSADGTVYWANSASGKIKSASTTEGNAKVRALVQGLSNPTAIALSNGYLYWSEATGGISRMSLTAKEKTVETIATGLGEPLSIAIAKGRIYWVESDVAGGGALQRANVDGSGNVQEVRVFAGNAPNAIAIDSLNNRLYWTKTQGKIQRANLSGRFVADIATGLMNPGGIAVGTPEAEAEPVVERPTRTTTTETATETTTQTTTQKTDSKYDVSGDGKLTDLDVDIILLAVALGAQSATYDVNGDGSVDTDDAKAVIDAVGDADAGAPAINVDVSGLDLNPDRLQEQIDLLIASGDTSFATQRMLAYFQHLLVSLRPAETVLLANYPNPFNPETWIPYHLSTSTDVQVNIYNAQGVLVRALTLGHQTAGYYTSRSRAAYWDGRNAIGERVASGIYFYQLQTDEVSPMRKMVILK